LKKIVFTVKRMDVVVGTMRRIFGKIPMGDSLPLDGPNIGRDGLRADPGIGIDSIVGATGEYVGVFAKSTGERGGSDGEPTTDTFGYTDGSG
jgi:hypothetical protein